MASETAAERTPGAGPATRVPALNGVRACAILLVVLLHLLGASGVLARTAGTTTGVVIWSILGNCVDIFLIVSGFVLFLPTIRRAGEFGSRADFWVGRAVRLLPAFWLVLAITLLAVAIKPPLDGYTFPSLVDIVSHIAVLQMPMTMFDSQIAIGFGVDGPLWLVSIVVCFYAILPFVAPSWYRHPWRWLAGAAALTIAWKLGVNHSPWIFADLSGRQLEPARLLAIDQVPGWAYSFALGMTGAWAYVSIKRRVPERLLERRSLQLALPVLLFYAFGAYLYGRLDLDVDGNVGQVARGETLTALINTTGRAALIGIVITGPLWLQRPFANRIMNRLADLSYGVYLIHWLIVMYAAAFLGLPTDGTVGAVAVWIAVVLPPSLAFAAASRRWIELPLQRRVKGRTRRPAPAPTAAAEAPARS